MWRTVRPLWYSIRAPWAWLPIIWRDDDWDYGHLLDILIFKLTRMYWSSMQWIEIEEFLGPKRESMLLAIMALTRVRDNYWEDMVGQIHRDRWGDSHCKLTPMEDGLTQVTVTYPGHDDWAARTDVVRLFRLAETLTQHDLDKAMDALKNMQEWWD